MTTLIVPAAGLSKRFGLDRPKFLLQHPKGLTMLAAGLIGLNKTKFNQVIIVSLKDYFTEINQKAIIEQVEEILQCDVNLILLDRPTQSMVDTINVGIQAMSQDDAIIVKDTDNFINLDSISVIGENFVAYADLSKFVEVNASNKSFIETDAHGFISNIVEKRIISPMINTGLVGFKNASDFVRASSKIVSAKEKYVSDVIRVLLDSGAIFNSVEVSHYSDWGTLDEWLRYCSKYATIFVDIDGVLARNENPYGIDQRNWSRFRAIENNIHPILTGFLKGYFRVIFTTSRSEKYRDSLTRQLSELGFEECEILMGLPHAKRILINDFAITNPFPSAIAINLHRDSENLADYLKN